MFYCFAFFFKNTVIILVSSSIPVSHKDLYTYDQHFDISRKNFFFKVAVTGIKKKILDKVLGYPQDLNLYTVTKHATAC